MTAVEPAIQAAFETVALFPHFTITVELLPLAVTVNVPDPAGPVSQIRTIVSGPAGVPAAKAVVEIATAPAPATSAATTDFKILIAILLPEPSIRRPSRNASPDSPVTHTTGRS
jgi:hypothetical protein